MAIELSTAGILVKYATESTAGTRPTTGYVAIPGVKSIPDMNPEPAQLDVTPLSETVQHRYIPGLKDPGGAIGLTCNYYADFVTAWETMMTAYAALTGGKGLWVEFVIPGMTNSFYFRAVPTELGFGGAEVDSVLEIVAYFTPNSAPVWATKST